MPQKPASIRAVGARLTLRVAANIGVDAARLLAAAGLTPADIASDDQRIPLHAIGRLLEQAAHMSQCPHLGLLVGSQADIEFLGYLGSIGRHAATVREAMDVFARMFILHSEGSGIVSIGSTEQPAFAYVVHETGIPGYDQLMAASLAICNNVLKTLCGPDFKVSAVYLPQRPPAHSAVYARIFGIMPHFNAEEATVCVARRWLDQPPVGTDPALAARLLRAVSGPLEEELVLRLKRVLRRSIALGHANASEEDIATALDLKVHTLRRRLREHALTYRDLVSEVRRDVASQLMRNSALSLTEISLVVGYANLSAFTRARQRWQAQGHPPDSTAGREQEEHTSGV